MSVFQEIYNQYINQPASIGLALIVAMWAHTSMDKMKWKYHDENAEDFRKKVSKGMAAVEKVEKYMLKFESEESEEKKRKLEEIITIAKNSVSIIAQKFSNYLLDVENLNKTEGENIEVLLDLAQRHMLKTWARLTSEGLHYEVSLMKETSEVLMSRYAEEIRFLVHIFHSEGLNGSKRETISRLLVSFEQLVVNSWEKYFRKLAI